MAEGSLDAPIRHPVPWQDADFYDAALLDDELRRVFDICHGCRRCFNLCDSFPRLFDLIDGSDSGELDTVSSAAFGPVVDACTLCDMCFLTKCPYVPPHAFNLDFPHLMLRYRAVGMREHGIPWADRQIAQTDRNGEMARAVSLVANWAAKPGNRATRPLLESALGIHRDAAIPRFESRPLTLRAKSDIPVVNTEAPAFGRRAVLYATCFSNYNNPEIGAAARRVLAHNGVTTEVVYPSCCGMPQLEQGDVEQVAVNAHAVARMLKPWIADGYDVIALVPSCALMLKFQWPLLAPDDPEVQALAQAARDIDEYMVEIARREGLADGLSAIDGGITVHIPCHSRAQNVGQKTAELLKLIPGAAIEVIERCSGHGGSWGVKKDNFETALKVGRPVAKQARKSANPYLVSGCPLAAEHILQGMHRIDDDAPLPARTHHPIELLAMAYGLQPGAES